MRTEREKKVMEGERPDIERAKERSAASEHEVCVRFFLH